MQRRVDFSDDASLDIESLFDYISQFNADAAEKLLERLEESISELESFPHKGVALTEEDTPGAERGWRKLPVAPYLVFYRDTGERIVVARVLHMKQNWLQHLFGTTTTEDD